MRLLSWHHRDRLATSSREAFSSLPEIRPTTTVSSANMTMVLELYLATQSCVYLKYSLILVQTQPWGDPVFRVRGLVVSAHPDDLGPSSEEVQDPGAQGGVQTQLNQLVSQSAANCGVERIAQVNKQHSLLRFVCPHLHVRLSLLPLQALHAPLRPASHQAYGIRVPLSFLWLPDSHAPRPPPAPPSRQSPPTPLTSLTRSRSPRFPARRLVRKGRSGVLASADDDTARLCSPALHFQSSHLSLICNHLRPLQEPGLHSTQRQILP